MAGRGPGQRPSRPPPSVYQQSDLAQGNDIVIVSRAEDSSVKGLSDPFTKLTALSIGPRFPARPGYGTAGHSIKLYTNHFTLKFAKPDLKISRYEFSIDPRAIGRKASEIISKFIEGLPGQLKSCCATDYRRYLVTSQPLPTSSTTGVQVVHTFDNEDEPEPGVVPANQIFHVTLHPPAVYRLADLLRSLQDPQHAEYNSKAEVIACLNIITTFDAKSCSRGPGAKLMATSANKHFLIDGSDAHIKNLGQGLQAARGYLTSVRPATGRLLLNAQIKHAAFFKDGLLSQLIREFDTGANHQSTAYDSRALHWFLKGLRVSVEHLPTKHNKAGHVILRIKTIHGLTKASDTDSVKCPDFGLPSQVKFKYTDLRSGHPEWRTVADHFKKAYGIMINDKFKVVNLGTERAPMFYPVEVCRVVPGQPATRDLSPEQTSNMTNSYAIRSAHQNAESIATQSHKMLGYTSPSSVLKGFGFDLGAQLDVVPGRILAPPSVHYSGKPYTANFGLWNLRNAQFCRPITNFEYVVLRIIGPGNQRWAQNPTWSSALQCWQNEMRNLGCGAKAPKQTLDFNYQHMNDRALEDVEKPIKRMHEVGWIKDTTDKSLPVRIVLIVSSTDNARFYKHVKTLMDTKLGARSVWALAHKFCKPARGATAAGDPQIMANILMKWNLQLGGVNQKLKAGTAGLYGDSKTMFMGYDVTHPSPNSRLDAPSIAAYVADVEGDTAQYPAIYRFQTKSKDRDVQGKKQAEEPAHHLQDVTSQFLKGWQHYHKRQLPQSIVLYRDGVSDGQLAMVRDEEVVKIKAACDRACLEAQEQNGQSHTIKLTLAVVGKRHNVRFYPTSSKSGEIDERSGSAPAGTVVDRLVTDPTRFDVYLQPHAAIQGTSKSAHYTIVHDEIFCQHPNLPPLSVPTQNAADYFQVFTNAICSTYGRATRSVSLAPPAYYADLAAFRARCWLSKYYSPTPADRGADNGAAAAAEGRYPEVYPAGRLQRTMHYI